MSSQGKMRYASGDEFDGEWNEDELYKGVLRCTRAGTEVVYDGSFSKGRREGKGVMKVGGSVVYEGFWHSDVVCSVYCSGSAFLPFPVCHVDRFVVTP